MTTYYVLLCCSENSSNHEIEQVLPSLEVAQTKMAECIATCVTQCSAKYPDSTVVSKVSNDNLASIVVYSRDVSRQMKVNEINYPELAVITTRQFLYTTMYIKTVNN